MGRFFRQALAVAFGLWRYNRSYRPFVRSGAAAFKHSAAAEKSDHENQPGDVGVFHKMAFL